MERMIKMALMDTSSHDLRKIIGKLQFTLHHKAEFIETNPIIIPFNWMTLTPKYLGKLFLRVYKDEFRYDCNTKKWYVGENDHSVLANESRMNRDLACIRAQTMVRAYYEGILDQFYRIIRTYDIQPGHLPEILMLWKYFEQCEKMHSMFYAKKIIKEVERLETETTNGDIVRNR